MTRKIALGISGIVLVAAIVIVGARILTGEDNWICQNGEWVKHGNPSGPKPTGTCKEGEQIVPKKVPTETTIPNPAAKNCLDKGGKLVSLKETAGELSICKFTDGSECEEWQFYRGECKKGQHVNADTSHVYRGTLARVNGRYSLKDSSGVIYSLEISTTASTELKERLTTEALSRETVTIIATESPPFSKKLILKSFVEK